MRNLALKISFLGSRYNGFQRQTNAYGVQNEIESALFKILNESVTIIGCSRTDTGVSAKEYVFNFTTENEITEQKLMGALNHFLPDDIAVLNCKEADLSFHSRYHTTGKQYVYTVKNSRQRDPFSFDRAYRYNISKIDADYLDREAKAFLGSHDFSAFCSVGDSVKSHVRTVCRADVKREGDNVYFTFEADGFLYNMVRIMVGTLLFVSEGKIKSGELINIIESGERKRAGNTAPAEGLCLNKVYYQNDPFEKQGGENV